MSYIGNTVQNQNYVPAIDYFNGDGSTVAFTLSRPVASVAAVQAVISNVPQNPGSAFTVSGSTITFTSAPPSGTANIYVYYTSPNTQIVQPGQGTVGTTQLATDLTLTNPTYTGTLTGGTGVVNIGSGQFYKDSSGNVGIGTSSPSYKLDVNGAANIQAGYNLNVYGSSASGTLAGLSMRGTPRFATDTGTFENTHILCGATYGNIIFSQGNSYTTASNTERMRIDSSGNLCVGTTNSLPVDNNIAGVSISNDYKGLIEASRDNAPSLQLNRMSSDGYLAYFFGQGINRGGIAVSGSTIQYNSFSDYRLKENIQPMQNALATVAQLNPVTYTWKADGSDGQGFIAHELQAVVPDAVNGEKDAVDDEGKPLYQGIDTSFLVATLTKAIQELNAKVDAQAAEIAALKGAA